MSEQEVKDYVRAGDMVLAYIKGNLVTPTTWLHYQFKVKKIGNESIILESPSNQTWTYPLDMVGLILMEKKKW